MIVRTSGSCSRIFSVRFFSDMRRAMVGPRPATIPTIAPSRNERRMATPRIAPTKKATPERTTNSPDRTATPADSSSASSRSLNPRDSAKRLPNLVTRLGIQPCVPSACTATGCFTPPAPVIAAMRAATSRSRLALDAVPSSSQPRAKTAEPTNAASTTCATGVFQNDAAITARPSPRGRTSRRRGTRRAPRACPGTSAAARWPSGAP